MKKSINVQDRRSFLIKCGASAIPVLLPPSNLSPLTQWREESHEHPSIVNFIFDGLALSPQEYLAKLNEINDAQQIAADFYGNGGATRSLEQEFARLTGKEKAIYLPTGTMANQLAIKLLSGNTTKVIVPENSHIYRDEADAAQSVHNKRLIPVGKGKPYFDLADLKEAIEYVKKGEVFDSGMKTLAIENPIRRADGLFIPIGEIKKISEYCRANGYLLHLDGARIHLACAYSNVSLAEYASYFDTVYISLYKYLNAAGGAILCGDAKLIDQVSHQIKILGGTMYQNWQNTAVAMHYLKGIGEKWAKVKTVAKELVAELNKLPELSLTTLENGTNIYYLKLNGEISLKKLAGHLYNEHSIWLGRAGADGTIRLTINESILTRTVAETVDAWKSAIHKTLSGED